MSFSSPSIRQTEVARDRVVGSFVVAALSVVVLYRHWPSSRMWLPAALAGIALAIWHGAYDAVLAKNLWQPRYPGKWLLPFVMSYVALSGMVMAAWYAFPVAALIAFLLYSGVHFGLESEHGGSPWQVASAIATGCLPIAASCHWQANSVGPIFAIMLHGHENAAQSITAVAGSMLIPCAVLALTFSGQGRRGLARRTLLITAQCLLFRFCPPVLSFAVFFCLLHTPEHLVETSRTAAGAFSAKLMCNHLRAGLGPWLISLAAIAIAAWAGRQTMQAYTGLLFVALSALTVPHMALAMLASTSVRRIEAVPFCSAQRAAHS